MTDDSETPRTGDRLVRYVAVVLAVVAIALAGWAMLDRIAAVAPGHDIPVVLPLAAEQGDWAFGRLLDRVDPGGQFAGSVDINSVTIPIADPSTGTLVALWADPIMRFLAVSAGAIVAALFLLRVAQGNAFEQGSARLVFIGTAIATAAWIAHAILTAIASNELRSRLFDSAHTNGWIATDLAPVAWILLLAAVGGAFRMGEKLRRETAGLV